MTTADLGLGEWACLGLVYPAPTHGFAIAARLRADGDVGRVWSLSRSLTYRALDQLIARGYVRMVGEEPGLAGGNRTIVAATRTGRARLRRWVQTPVLHLRDVRTELLLKLIIADACEIGIGPMLELQHAQIKSLAAAIGVQGTDRGPADLVALWRMESSQAALRFVGRLRGEPCFE